MADRDARNPILSPFGDDEEKRKDNLLRPRSIDEFIGQSQLIEKMQLFIEAAKRRGEPLDHVLLFGPPGLGKTTMARIIAEELGVGFKQHQASAIDRKDSLAAILTDVAEGDVLFIDEIHRLAGAVEECMYPAMEDYEFHIVIGDGPHGRSIKLDLERFTLVGATTRLGMLTPPLRARFPITERLRFYNEDELDLIAKRTAGIVNVGIDAEGSREIARRSRGTPRITNRLVNRVRDYAQVRADGHITRAVAGEAFSMFEIDDLGLEHVDRLFLETIIDKFGGGPVGLNSIAVAISEDEDTIEDYIEPYLIQIGFMKRTPRGRVLTERAFEHLGRQDQLQNRSERL